MEQNKKAVLVTGSSSGIGKKIVEELITEGYYVYATCRNEEDKEIIENEFSHYSDLHVILMDINSPDDRNRVVKLVSSQNRGLHALINNAGILIGGPIEHFSDEKLSLQLSTNFLSPMDLTQKFLEILIENQGYIIQISSLSSKKEISLLGPYIMSKQGLDSYSKVLRTELSKKGLKVVTVRPDVVKTSFHNKKDFLNIKMFKDTDYGPKLKIIKDSIINDIEMQGMDPLDVALTVVKILKNDKPKSDYIVTKSSLKRNKFLIFGS